MYSLLVNIGLTLIQNLYYIDDDKLVEGVMTIEECILKAEPIILDLKLKFEHMINEELFLTHDEFNILKGGK